MRSKHRNEMYDSQKKHLISLYKFNSVTYTERMVHLPTLKDPYESSSASGAIANRSSIVVAAM